MLLLVVVVMGLFGGVVGYIPGVYPRGYKPGETLYAKVNRYSLFFFFFFFIFFFFFSFFLLFLF